MGPPLGCAEAITPWRAEEGYPNYLGRTPFGEDLVGPDALGAALQVVAADLATRLAARHLAGRTLILKVRFSDFKVATRSQTLSAPIAEASQMAAVALRLLSETDAAKRRVRLLGITLTKLSGAEDAPCDRAPPPEASLGVSEGSRGRSLQGTLFGD